MAEALVRVEMSGGWNKVSIPEGQRAIPGTRLVFPGDDPNSTQTIRSLYFPVSFLPERDDKNEIPDLSRFSRKTINGVGDCIFVHMMVSVHETSDHEEEVMLTLYTPYDADPTIIPLAAWQITSKKEPTESETRGAKEMIRVYTPSGDLLIQRGYAIPIACEYTRAGGKPKPVIPGTLYIRRSIGVNGRV